MSEGSDHMGEFDGDISLFLVGENSMCKCVVGNTILGYEQFHLKKSTFDEEVSCEIIRESIGTRWITVIQTDPQTEKQRLTETYSRCPCMVLFVLQCDNISRTELETLANFQQIGTKMREKTVVVLVNSEDEPGRPNNIDENLEMFLYQCGYKVCYLNKNMEQIHFIKLITYRKRVSEMQVHEQERTTAVKRESPKPQEKMTPETFSGGTRAAVEKNIHGGNQSAVKMKNTLTIVLLGQTGSGKSASGNTILRKAHFDSHASSMPVTQVCKMAEETVCGIKIRVIDTPDFFDEEVKNPEEQIKHCRELSAPGPDVYLLVMELGRFTDGEREIVQNIQRVFSTQVAKETIVLFTNREKLRGKTVPEYIKNTDTELQELIRICGSRYHAFNNNDPNVPQVERLIEMILEMKRKSGGADILENYSYYKESDKKDCIIQ